MDDVGTAADDELILLEDEKESIAAIDSARLLLDDSLSNDDEERHFFEQSPRSFLNAFCVDGMLRLLLLIVLKILNFVSVNDLNLAVTIPDST